MSSYLRINNFVSASNQALANRAGEALLATSNSFAVSRVIPRESFEQKALNQQTWRLFRESVQTIIGQQKYEWICNRYRGRYEFSKIERAGGFLLPQHVEAFSVGASQLLSQDIKQFFPGKMKESTRTEITTRMKHLTPFGNVGCYIHPLRIYGSPGNLSAHFVHDCALMDKEKQLLFSDTESISTESWIERFAKVTVNRELIEKQVIPAPGRDGRLDYYRVYRKITTGDGLIAYALKPCAQDSTLKPLIIFRPSQFAFANEDAIETYLNDVQPHIGEMGWEKGESLIEELMNDSSFCPSNEKVSIAGYSLGGAHAQYFLAKYHQRVRDAIFYANPSVEESIAERAALAINTMPRRDEPLNIQIIRIEGDFCHYVGGKHVGWGVSHPDVSIKLVLVDPLDRIDSDNRIIKLNALQRHSYRFYDTDQPLHTVQIVQDSEELKVHLNNSARGPDKWWYERMRRLWGGVAFYSLLGVAEVIKFISSLLGIKVLRRSVNPLAE